MTDSSMCGSWEMEAVAPGRRRPRRHVRILARSTVRTLGLTAAVLALLLPAQGWCGLGLPNPTQAATLVVPMIEAGISSSNDTLLVVHQICAAGPYEAHWEIWDIDGSRLGLSGNLSLGQGETWSSNMSSLLAAATPSQLAQITDGDFYRGFMTIDNVTTATTKSPLEVDYPFAGDNCFTGRVYYVRLAEGAANAMPMIHIQGGLASTMDSNVLGFYQFDDDREEIDNHAWWYNHLSTLGEPIADDPDDPTVGDAVFDYVVCRAFRSAALNGQTRVVLWTWGPAGPGPTVSPSAYTGGNFDYWHLNEVGTNIDPKTIALDHIVNIIDVTGNASGEIYILKIPENFNVYGFSLNSAEGSAAETWEGLIECTLMAQWNSPLDATSKRSSSNGEN